jgi:predicted phage replisome organizer/uncharacterized phage protein (TIGR02220 family)
VKQKPSAWEFKTLKVEKMADVKWIKLSTTMFDDEKIRLIQAMPESDAIIVIWVRLLTLAGKTNAEGQVFISENMPYNEEMFSTLFNKPVNTIRLAIDTLKKFGMIDIFENGTIFVNNWEKHQNIEGMDKIKTQNAERARKYREKKKLKQLENSNVTSRDSHALDIEEDKDKDKEEEIDKEKKNNIPFPEIITYLNEQAKTNFKSSTPKTRDFIKARWNEGFTLEDFKQVINKKVTEWINDKEMCKYLRPETLFGTKFESYLNQKEVKPNENNKSNYEGYDFDKEREFDF